MVERANVVFVDGKQAKQLSFLRAELILTFFATIIGVGQDP